MTDPIASDDDREHRKAANTAALDMLMDLNTIPRLTRSQGVDVIVAIVRGQIPAVSIQY